LKGNSFDLLKTCQFGLVVYFYQPEMLITGCLNNRGSIPENGMKKVLLQTRFWGPRSYTFQLLMAFLILRLKRFGHET
jgi:hypothetical protein